MRDTSAWTASISVSAKKSNREEGRTREENRRGGEDRVGQGRWGEKTRRGGGKEGRTKGKGKEERKGGGEKGREGG